ncbi:hypothetical protein CS0771_52330 [Catellatospora sp. IY07-71]|uniref:hypothetical protein n=1 Tax=Catellatospora sp. IY07-71 TaxID=2728827 RepID=UPI001BB31182|nr:hypothetical protein [Catellatospora sp. IY07-71]BCJ75689.1 hypothetical protein CS0771_52330 [Catellatospora sp. IY07-71]
MSDHHTDAWTPPRRPACTCPEHVADLHELVVPSVPPHHLPPTTVRELRDTGDLSVQPLPERERRWTVHDEAGDVTGVDAFQWVLWAGDAARCFYDDDAELALDDSLRQREGIAGVSWMDREVLYVAAPTMCADGVLAAAARALLDPRVR